MQPTTTDLATIPGIENVDDLLQFLDESGVTERQRDTIPLLWFQYPVERVAQATGISRNEIYRWLQEPEFAFVVKEGRARRREMLSRYLHQAGYLSFQRVMDLLATEPESDKIISEQQKTARFVIGEINLEPERVEHVMDTRVLAVAQEVEDRMAAYMSDRVVDAMPKLLTLDCVEEAESMGVLPNTGQLNVYHAGREYLLQCHECQGWFRDLGKHVEDHDMSKRKYADKYQLVLDVFEEASFVA